jgi:hypothetical protein
VSGHFVSLGLGRYARADRILALEPIEGEERGPGRRTRVWVEGLAEPVVASRSESAILADIGSVPAPSLAPARRASRRRGEEPPSLF